jgi:hypothetical protein
VVTNHGLDRRVVRSALALATAAPSADNSQPWRWTADFHGIHLYADRRRGPVSDGHGRDMMVSCGVALHHLQVALAASGLTSSVRRMPNPDEPRHLATLDVRPRAASDADLGLASAILRRRSDRRRFADREVPVSLVGELVARAAAQGGQLRPVTTVGQRAHLVDAIRATPEVDGSDATDVDGGSAAGAHRSTEGRIDQAANGEPDATVLMMLVTGSDGSLAQLRAGEALSAVLLRATVLGLATCSLTRPLAVGSGRRTIQTALLDGTAVLQLVLRVGWAPAGAPLAPTPRRPIDDMITWLPA